MNLIACFSFIMKYFDTVLGSAIVPANLQVDPCPTGICKPSDQAIIQKFSLRCQSAYEAAPSLIVGFRV